MITDDFSDEEPTTPTYQRPEPTAMPGEPDTVEASPRQWRIAFWRDERRKARAERAAAKAEAAAMLHDAHAALVNIATGQAASDGWLEARVDAASRHLDAMRDWRDRRFRYVATIGTWITVLVWTAMLTMCGSCAAVPKGTARPTSFAQIDATVKIRTWCIDDTQLPAIKLSAAGGSGVAIDGHRVLTAQHVIDCDEGWSAITVEMPDGRRFGANVARKYGTDVDIAELRVEEDLGVPLAAIARRDPNLGDEVCISTAVPERTWQCGKVTKYGDPPGNMRHTIPVQRGNSGSGLYNSAGQLVGIITHLIPCNVIVTPEGVQIDGSCGGKATTLRGRVAL